MGNAVGAEVVDADLQVIEPGPVEASDAIGSEQVSVCDQLAQYCRWPADSAE